MSKFPKSAFLSAFMTGLMLCSGTSEASDVITLTNDVGEASNEKVKTTDLISNLEKPYLDYLSGRIKETNKHLPFHAAAEEEVLVEMDFSDFTSGSETELGECVTQQFLDSGIPTIEPVWMNGEVGWTGIGVYSAGGTCALAQPGLGGCINTPAKNYYGRLHITFKVRAREDNVRVSTFPVFVSVCTGDAYYPVAAINDIHMEILKNEDLEWRTVDVTFNCDYDRDDAFVQINGCNHSDTGVLIDDLKITRDYEFATIPSNLTFRRFTDNGFSALWLPGAENKSFLVNLQEERVVSTEETTYSEDFNYGIPENWVAEDAIEVSEGGFDNSSAIKLGSEGLLQFPINYATLNDVSLFIQPNLNDDSEGSMAIEVLFNGDWLRLGKVNLTLISSEGTELSISQSVPNFAGNYTGIRFIPLNFKEEEYVLIDEAVWSTDGVRERSLIVDAMPVNENEVTFEDIDFNAASYFMQVAGVNGEIITDYTPWSVVEGIIAPNLLPATNINNEPFSFTANWERAENADGYIVKAYQQYVLKAEENRVAFADYFSNAVSGNDVPGYDIAIVDSFDGLTDMPGWTIDMWPGMMADMKIGASAFSTPEMALQNNNGVFTLKCTASSWGRCPIVFQSGLEKYVVTTNGEYDPSTGNYAADYVDVELTFHNGAENTVINIYSLDYNYVLVSDFVVTQDVKDGDYSYSLLSSATVESSEDSYTFNELPVKENDNLAFGVHAFRYLSNGTIYTSETNPFEIVKFQPSEVEKLFEDSLSGIKVFTNDDSINVVLDMAAEIHIFNTSGTCVATICGTEGINSIHNLVKGIYIVTCNNFKTKVIL